MPLTNLLHEIHAAANQEKQRSELVATRDPFTGQSRIMPEEEMEAFTTFVRSLVDSLEPAGALERQLAQSYATFQWRINRAAAIEDTLFTFGNIDEVAESLNIRHAEAHNAASRAIAFRDHSDHFTRIAMYTQRLVNQSETVFKRLQKLQADRKQREQAQLLEASRLYRLAQLQKQAFDPPAHGYSCNLSEVQSFTRREILNADAATAQRVGWDPGLVQKYCGQAAA